MDKVLIKGFGTNAFDPTIKKNRDAAEIILRIEFYQCVAGWHRIQGGPPAVFYNVHVNIRW